MITVWKYPVGRHGLRIKVPDGATFIHTAYQVHEGFRQVVVWAVVDRDRPPVEYEVRVIGTGWDFPDDLSTADHVGTLHDGPFVWHIFIRRVPPA